MTKRSFLLSALAGTVIASSASPALAGSHLWVVNEVFSNADGTIQFIEMHVPLDDSNETSLSGRWVRSTTTTNQFTFSENLPPGSSAYAYILLATAGFAALPDAPTPDHIISDGFFDTDADTIKYFTYGNGDLSFTSGELPLDGVTSLDRFGSTGQNSPTNFAGESGSVDAGGGQLPTASERGLLIMITLLVAGGVVAIWRRQRVRVL
jgi:hypothetical protein